MSESTGGSDWISAAEFHRAPGVADWRVTGTGPQTVFTAASLSHAAGLVAPIVAAAERFAILPDIDVRPEGVVVRIPDRSPQGIPAACPGVRCRRVPGRRGTAADARSLARAVDRHRVAQHSQADSRPFFMAALGYQAFGDTDAVDPLRLRAAARLQSHHRRRSGERPHPLRRLRAGRSGAGAGGCRTRSRRKTRRRFVRPPGGPSHRPTTTAWTSRPGPTPTTELPSLSAERVGSSIGRRGVRSIGGRKGAREQEQPPHHEARAHHLVGGEGVVPDPEQASRTTGCRLQPRAPAPSSPVAGTAAPSAGRAGGLRRSRPSRWRRGCDRPG